MPRQQPGGPQRKRWERDVKEACYGALLAGQGIRETGESWGVPEATLRAWRLKARALPPDEQARLLAAARDSGLAALRCGAAQGAVLAEEMIRRRLAEGDSSARRAAEIRERLFGGACSDEEAKALRKELDALPLISDYPMANYMRALYSVCQRPAAEAKKEKPGGQTLRLVLDGEVEKYAR